MKLNCECNDWNCTETMDVPTEEFTEKIALELYVVLSDHLGSNDEVVEKKDGYVWVKEVI